MGGHRCDHGERLQPSAKSTCRAGGSTSGSSGSSGRPSRGNCCRQRIRTRQDRRHDPHHGAPVSRVDERDHQGPQRGLREARGPGSPQRAEHLQGLARSERLLQGHYGKPRIGKTTKKKEEEQEASRKLRGDSGSLASKVRGE